MDWRWAAVAVFAVTAGCAGFTGFDGEPTTTVTPVPVPDAEVTPTPESGLAPGLTSRGVQDVDALATSHLAIIRDTSYVWRDRQTTSRRYPNGTTTTSDWQLLRVENERRYLYETDSRELRQRADNHFRYNVTEYADGNRRHRRYYEPGKATATYEQSLAANATSAYGLTAAGYITLFLDLPEATVVAVERDGQRYYRVTGERGSIPALGDVQNASVNATVSPEGFVPYLNVTYRRVTGARTEIVTYRYAYEAVGNTTVERPAWVDSQAAETERPTGAARHRLDRAVSTRA